MTNPLNASFSIRLFGNIINTVAGNLFNDMLIHTGFLCRGEKKSKPPSGGGRGGEKAETIHDEGAPLLCVFWLAT